MLYANFTTLCFIDPEVLPIEVLHCGNREFCGFFAKNSVNYYFFLVPKNNVTVAEAHFVTDCSSLYATVVKRIQSVVLRRIGGRGHFRSRDKDGGHTIRSAIAENPMLYANFTTLSFI